MVLNRNFGVLLPSGIFLEPINHDSAVDIPSYRPIPHIKSEYPSFSSSNLRLKFSFSAP
jgi:hypothetical protein